MAQDAMAVMDAYGFERFQVLAHDRGARVAHRLAADHPDAVERLMLLDIAPRLPCTTPPRTRLRALTGTGSF
jgi:haloacetate dehalogenase